MLLFCAIVEVVSTKERKSQRRTTCATVGAKPRKAPAKAGIGIPPMTAGTTVSVNLGSDTSVS